MTTLPPCPAHSQPAASNTRYTWMTFTGLALMSALVSAWPLQAAAAEPQLDLERTSLQVGLFRIDAQVAQTAAQRSTGLMWRQGMPVHEGMLFVFERPAVQCFWMKNTLIPLTAAFVADNGRIVNLVDMKPQSEQSHCSTQPVRYVLEMNQGWFTKRGMGAGFQLKGVPFTAH